MMHVSERNRILRMFAAALPAVVFCMLLVSPQQIRGASETYIKYRLMPVEGDPSAVDVALSFKVEQGKKAVLKQNFSPHWKDADMAEPKVELLSPTGPAYQIEGLPPPDGGWVLTAPDSGEVAVRYRVVFAERNLAKNDAEAPGGVAAPGAIVSPELTVVRSSDVLMCPREQSGTKPLSERFQVDLSVPKGQKVLAPWAANGKGGYSFLVSGEAQLLENFLAWGSLDMVTLRERDPRVVVGFSSDYAEQSASQRNAYGRSLSLLLDNLMGSLGSRPRLERLSVVLTGTERTGLKRPFYDTLMDSTVIYHGGEKLTGRSAAAAAGGLFQLWNGYSLVPASNGEAEWFQAGLPLFYPLRVAAITGLMDSGEAFQDFSEVYRSYLMDPGASSTSLAEAESSGENGQLLANKGAAVCASLSKKLQDESKGSSKDIDWLLGRMAAKFNHFNGKDYSLVDISELLESATGQSWDRYFQHRVRRTGAVLTSEFSETGLFGAAGLGKSVVVGGGSGRSWIYLLIAVCVILLIPVIFSTYVRRSVKLDLTMPKILPDDDED